MIFTIWKEEVDQNENIIDGRIYFNDLEGKFIDGYRIENGVFTKRFVVKKTIQKASFLYLFFFQPFQDSEENGGSGGCWNKDNLPVDGVFDEVVFKGHNHNWHFTQAPGLTGGTNYSYQQYVNNATDGFSNNDGGSYSLSSGQVTSAAAAILMTSPIDPDEMGNCPDGYTKNPTTGKCESICSGGKYYNETSQKCECPEGMIEDNNGNCVNTPTPCETALLSRDVYNTTNGQQELGKEPIPIKLSGGWELNNTLDTSSMNLTDLDSGFNSAVYQKLVNGVYQYMYVTEGSTFEGVQDWYNNISQIPGNSKQYQISVNNAEILDRLVGNKQLYFTGHSLGGGLASVNSLATGRTAYTYNAAGLSHETRLLYIRGHNSEINATVVKGEIVDKIQSQFGIKAEDSDLINYIEEESTYWQDFFNERSPALNTYKAARLHFIDSVINILDCE